MSLTDSLIRKLDRLQSRPQFFVAWIALLGTLLVGSSLVAWNASREQESLTIANARTLRILRSAHTLRTATLNTMRGERDYMLTGDAASLEPYISGRGELVTSLDDLESQLRDQSENEADMAVLHGAATAYLGDLARTVALARAGEMDKALAEVRRRGTDDGAERINAITMRIIDDERAHFRALQAHVDAVTATMLRFIYLMSFTGLCLLVLAVLSGIALRRSFARERLYREELRKKAATDELTGIANRRELLAYLDKRIAEARRTDTPLSFAMFDIDNFKRVNDGYGHAVGDEAIRHVVRQAQGVVRINDRIGRMGGEEFGVVLPKSSEENAYVVCERMLARLRENRFALEEGEPLLVTISTGVASLNEEDDAASLIERADKALYEAKRSGRDQVRLAA